jgi:hypothetical protein
VLKDRLVADYIDHGRTVLEVLRRDKFPITEAFWYNIPEVGQWRLIIASPMAHIVGPNQTYAILDRALTKIRSPLSLSDISVLSPSSYQFQSLRQEALGPGTPGTGPATGSREIAFPDAYLYALPPNALPPKPGSARYRKR